MLIAYKAAQALLGEFYGSAFERLNSDRRLTERASAGPVFQAATHDPYQRNGSTFPVYIFSLWSLGTQGYIFYEQSDSCFQVSFSNCFALEKVNPCRRRHKKQVSYASPIKIKTSWLLDLLMSFSSSHKKHIYISRHPNAICRSYPLEFMWFGHQHILRLVGTLNIVSLIVCLGLKIYSELLTL